MAITSPTRVADVSDQLHVDLYEEDTDYEDSVAAARAEEQTMVRHVTLPAYADLDLNDHQELADAINKGTMTGPVHWDVDKSQWLLLDGDIKVAVDASTTLVIFRHTWDAPCPWFGRNLYIIETTAGLTERDRNDAKRAAKQAWQAAISRPHEANKIWFVLYCQVSLHAVICECL